MANIFNQTHAIIANREDFRVEVLDEVTRVTLRDSAGNFVTLTITNDVKAYLAADLIRPEIQKETEGKAVRVFGIPRKLLEDIGLLQ